MFNGVNYLILRRTGKKKKKKLEPTTFFYFFLSCVNQFQLGCRTQRCCGGTGKVTAAARAKREPWHRRSESCKVCFRPLVHGGLRFFRRISSPCSTKTLFRGLGSAPVTPKLEPTHAHKSQQSAAGIKTQHNGYLPVCSQL